jgi:membrane peptidoglycan carboxypeptidase
MPNFTYYGAVLQCGSILKPLFFLEFFENYYFNENTRLYNGYLEAYTYNPGNVSDRLLNKEVLVSDVLKYSLNKSAVNHRVSSDPLKVARRVEDKLLDMGISPYPSYRLVESYILGTKTMTPREVSQAYQMIFNRGESVPLGPWKYIINPHLQDTIFNGTAKKGSSMYAEVQANKIKALLKGAFETGGTCHGLLQFLPGNRQYYGKTGTTGKAKDGWTIISDGQKLIVVWAGYVKNDNGVLTRKDAPEIPSKSGAGSAGIFAAMVYSKLYD